MRKVIFIIIILMTAVSCREKQACYQCKFYTLGLFGHHRELGTEYKCGMTKDDKNFYEKANTATDWKGNRTAWVECN